MKILNILSWITLSFIYVVAGVMVFWSVYPYKTLEFKSKLLVPQTTVRQGGYLEYISDYCKYVDLPATISRSFVNGIVFTTPLTFTDRAKGCNKIKVGIVIPPELAVGKYHLEIIYQYKVNPVRAITIKNESEEFYIIQ